MKKFMSLFCVVILLFSLSVPANAQEMSYPPLENPTNVVNSEIVSEISVPSREFGKADCSTFQNVDYIIANSTEVITRGNEKRGNYTSAKYDAGFVGYTYEISFSWIAYPDSDQNYAFTEISDAKVTTYTNYLVLGMAYSYYNYKITKNTYDISSDGYYVEFYTNYEFTVIPQDTYLTQTWKKDNTKTIVLETIM